MSSASGDENEVTLFESVRRTRSGRSRKSAATGKKSPVKKLLARATRSPRKVQETEEMEEDESVIQETTVVEGIPENGVQRFADIIVEQHSEEGNPVFHLELEHGRDATMHEINMNQAPELEQSLEGVSDLEVSTSTMEVINEDGETVTQVTEILEAEVLDADSVSTTRGGGAVIQVTEMEASHQEISETAEDSVERLSQGDTVPSGIDTTEETCGDMHIDMEDMGQTRGKKTEPDTEAVSEDELPTEATAKEPETEAVSDEELPAAAPADLGETESVSEDELPPDGEKKKKSGSKGAGKVAEKKTKVEGGTTKRKLNAEGEYDPSSPTSENNDETPAKKVALAVDAELTESCKQETKPVSPKKKTLPELEKYWKAVNEDPSDFTGWTYLLQYVDQENDAEAAREAYSKFLERYPYCYGYWRKFADYEKKKGNPENVQTVSRFVYVTV